MMSYARSLYAHRELLKVWTKREIQVRYKQSILGVAWAILQPLVLMIIFSVVFSFIARIPTDGVAYPIFSYTALLPWTFLATSISFASVSLVNNMNLVTKIYFPREVLPISTVLAAFVDFLIASTVFMGLVLFFHVPVTINYLWLPLIILIQIMLTLGIVLPLAALSVRFRDIRFVVPLGLQIGMFASPVIYPISIVPDRLLKLYMLNPMAGLINSYRRVILLGQSPQLESIVYSGLFAFFLLLLGYNFFKRLEVNFADII